MTDVSDRAHQHLAAWFSQMPTFALMGEFSAGKSTLLNLIIGETILPTKVTATNMPVIWMTYGNTIAAHSLSHDGHLAEFDPATLADQGPKGHLLIRLSLPSETLRRSDIIDTPGISDRRLNANALNFIQPYLDFVVWCSAANQAWRQTEKAVWQKLPKTVHAQSILTLTRADTMTKSNDLQKVIKRCRTDTDGTFRAVQPIATVVAQKALGADGAVIDQAAWQRSHAEDLFTEIKNSLRVAQQSSAQRDRLEIPDPMPVSTASAVTEIPVSDEAPDSEACVDSEPGNDETIVKTDSEITEYTHDESIAILLRQLRQIQDGNRPKDQQSSDFEHLLSRFKCDEKMSDAHQLVLGRAMSLDGSSLVPPKMVKAQLVREIEDFAHNPWCQLDKVH